MTRAHQPGQGFTLIELLIVVSIIAILAAIAVPNFLDAQTRSKVSRVKSDMRTLAGALETYHLDGNNYPYRRNTKGRGNFFPYVPEAKNRLHQMSRITTPIAYLTTLPPDVFEKYFTPPANVIDYYDPTQVSWMIKVNHPLRPQYWVEPGEAGWLLVSVGPDGFLGVYDPVGYSTEFPIFNPDGWLYDYDCRSTYFISYDPTNGTVSRGNIFRGRVGNDDAGRILFERIKKGHTQSR